MVKSKTQNNLLIELKAKSSKKKKIERLKVCGKENFNPKTHACICLGNGKCVVVKKKKDRKKKKSKKQQQLEKKQNQTINYLNRFPERVNEAFGRPSNNYSSNLQRTNAETLLHRTLRDRYEVNERDIPSYTRYLNSLVSDDRILPRRVSRRQIPQTELERELAEEIEIAEDLQPIVNNNRENPRRMTEDRFIDMTQEIEDYRNPKSPRQLEAEERFKEARDYYERTGNIQPVRFNYDPNINNRNRLLPPPSQRNIRLMREYQQNLNNTRNDINTRLRLTEGNIARIQRRLRGSNKINYTADNDGVSITESELGKLGVIPEESSEESTDGNDSVISMTKEEIQDLIKKIQSNKRYSNEEINTRREAFLKMIEDIEKQEKNDPQDIEPAELEMINDDVEEEKAEPTEIDIDSESSTYEMDSPSKLRKAMMRNQLENDEDNDSDLFSSYSLQSLADNDFREEEDADSMSEVGSELEMEAPPLGLSETAPAYEADEA